MPAGNQVIQSCSKPRNRSQVFLCSNLNMVYVEKKKKNPNEINRPIHFRDSEKETNFLCLATLEPLDSIFLFYCLLDIDAPLLKYRQSY